MAALTTAAHDNGTCLHDHPTTESFQFTVTMHPDGSVEGVTTMEAHLVSGESEPLHASCVFLASDERTTAIMHYETELTFQAARNRTFEYIDDIEKRASVVAAHTKRLQTNLAASKVVHDGFRTRAPNFGACSGHHLKGPIPHQRVALVSCWSLLSRRRIAPATRLPCCWCAVRGRFHRARHGDGRSAPCLQLGDRSSALILWERENTIK